MIAAAACPEPTDTETSPTVADILRRYWPEYLAAHGPTLGAHPIHVLTQLIGCRTPELGGSLWQCGGCGHEHVFYHSCGHRQCPTCGGGRRHAWLDWMIAESLPVPYVHVVTTTPHELTRLALANRPLVYGLLFDATREALQRLTSDCRVLGAEIGGLMMLHTWGQRCLHHMHVHTLLPAGGLSFDRTRWITAADGHHFVSRAALMRTFRALFLAGLEKLLRGGRLQLDRVFGPVAAGPQVWGPWLAALHQKDWVVNVQGPPAECRTPEAAIQYVSRYMQGSAISNGRILADDGAQVTFRAKDYRHGGAPLTLTVSGPEFVRRFLLHVLPRRFSRIRYFGIFSRRSKKVDLPLCRRLLEAAHESSGDPASSHVEAAAGSVEAERDDSPEQVAQVDQVDQIDEPAEPESVARCQGCGRRGTLRWRGEIPGSTGWQRFCRGPRGDGWRQSQPS